MRQWLVLLFFIFLVQVGFGQVYLEKQTRHRFAQLNMGFDIEASFGGQTMYLNQASTIQSLSLENSFSPRFLIGGTHFWGYADFYIAIPLFGNKTEKENQEITALRGVETVFKYYPLRIENKKIRPYIGTSLAPFYYEQNNGNLEYESGPELNHTSLPFLFGLTFNRGNHLVELGAAWNYNSNQDYYISRNEIAQIQTPLLYASLSYRYMIETTLSAEKDWESGRTEEVTQILADRGRLNGFYF